MKYFIKFIIIAMIFCVTSGLKNIDDEPVVESQKIKIKKEESAESSEPSDSLQKLNVAQEFTERVQNIKNISADFTQSENVINSDNKKIIKGKLKLAKPNKFLWEIDSPIKERQVYVTDGNKYWHYDLGLEQVVVDDFKLEKIMNSPLAILLDSPENIAKNYKIEKFNNNIKNNADVESYKLIAKTGGKYIQYIEIFFAKLSSKVNSKINSKINKKNNKNFSNYIIKQINFTVGNGKNIIIQLDKVLVNQYINNNVFILKPAKGVDIINSNELM